MGTDKALLMVDGVPLVRRTADAAITAGATAVITVAAPEPVSSLLPGVPDRWPGEGPLGGVVAALGALDAEVVLVVSCDLLDPSPEAMRMTVAALDAAPGADIAVPMAGGRRQWLHAAWRRRSVLDGLVVQFEWGLRAIHRAVSEANLRVHEVGGIADAAVVDVDTPDDLRATGRTWAVYNPRPRPAS